MTADASIRGAIESLRQARADNERVGAAAHEVITKAIDRLARTVDHAGIAGLAERLGAMLRQAAEAARDQRAPIDTALGAEIDALDELLAGGAVSGVTAAAGPVAAASAGSATSGQGGKPAAPEVGEPADAHPLQLQIKTVTNPLDLVPEDAQQLPFYPIEGGSTYGANYKWKSEGKTIRLRIHGPDASAPEGSNSASGVTYRVQIGKKFLDKDGGLHHHQAHNPDSPNHDSAAANATHIPWPADVPEPSWENP